mmetsp:Transcript_140699/g.244974  ORF Transcript_140699/g.244974 Transcript_140699/m.244974 type:complete len:120 (-) Transcript_140699:239-598(-)
MLNGPLALWLISAWLPYGKGTSVFYQMPTVALAKHTSKMLVTAQGFSKEEMVFQRRVGHCPDKDAACKACRNEGNKCESCYVQPCQDNTDKFCWNAGSSSAGDQCTSCPNSAKGCDRFG